MECKSNHTKWRPLAAFLTLSLFLCTSWFCTKTAPLAPGNDTQGPLQILVSLQSSPAVVVPGGSSIIQAMVLNDNNEPVPGQDIRFSANLGSVSPASSTTNQAGIAVCNFSAAAQSGTAVVTATYDSTQIRSVSIEVKNTDPRGTALVPEETSLLANGVSFTTIESTWKTEEGEPLSGIEVTFETTVGSITPSEVTNSSGKASAILTSPASRVDAAATITARGSGIEATTQVLFRGVEFSLSATPATLIADGRSTATVKAVLKEATSFVAISNAEITLGADLGTIPNAVTTNASGVAQANLTSAIQTGVATITVRYGQTLSESIQVTFGQSVPTYLNLSADPPVILADNRSTSTIKAVVSDQSNNPVPDGTPVNFEIIGGSGTIESNQVTEAGVATSILTSGNQPDTVTVVARVDQLSDTTSVRYIVGEAASITVTADSTSLAADGTASTQVTAFVSDAAGHPVSDGTRVSFAADIGEVTPTAQTTNGQASAQFTSNVTGVARITASVGQVDDVVTIQLRPGQPNTILLAFDPTSLGVKDSGRNQSITITAGVVDSKNNPVADGTYVVFSIFSSPGGGEFISNTNPIPTLNGSAQVSLNSGVRSGSVRILAQVTDAARTPVFPEVRAVSTEIIIFAGPPYFEDINDPGTSHLSVGVAPSNIFGWNIVNNTATVTVVVGDKFNNPVPAGTAVFFTTSAGVISTHTGFTNEDGVASVVIHSAQPYPTIRRYYNTFFDPNAGHPDFNKPDSVIQGAIPDFERSEVLNSEGDLVENDGVARILAVTEGVDASGNPARIWSVTSLVFSGVITTCEATPSSTSLAPGEASTISFKIYDVNGNPIVPGSDISIGVQGGALSWSNLTTDDPGITHFSVSLTNNLDPSDPDAREIFTPVTITVISENGRIVKSTEAIHLRLN